MPAGSEGSTLDDYGPPRENDSSETIEAKGPPPMAPFDNPFGNASSQHGMHSVIGSDGSFRTVTSTGNMAFSSDGTTYTRCGNTVFSSKRTVLTETPSGIASSDGTFFSRIGNTLFGSDGSFYTSF